jgi:hypothetical protein
MQPPDFCAASSAVCPRGEVGEASCAPDAEDDVLRRALPASLRSCPAKTSSVRAEHNAASISNRVRPDCSLQCHMCHIPQILKTKRLDASAKRNYKQQLQK